MTYAQKLKDPRWQKRRLHILEQRGWKCERCRDDKTTLHVHHKKYRGEPWDALDHDLEVLCEPCHSGQHGKSVSPLKVFSVYCAGKIARSDWRHSLFNLSLGEGFESFWEEPKANVRAFYAGPYFADSQHGSAHVEETTHAQFDDDWLENRLVPSGHTAQYFFELPVEVRMQKRYAVKRKCYSWMRSADVMFAYIDAPCAYGTCAEIEWWASQKSPTARRSLGLFFASESLLDAYWFLAARVWPENQEWDKLIEPNVRNAFSQFLRWSAEYR